MINRTYLWQKLLPKEVFSNTPENYTLLKLFEMVDNATVKFKDDLDKIYSTYSGLKRKIEIQVAVDSLNQAFQEHNKIFRKCVLKLSPKAKKYNIYVMSNCGKKLEKKAEELFKWKYSFSKRKVDGKIKGSWKEKPGYKWIKATELLPYSLALLFNKYEKVYEFQFKAQIYKTIADIFDLSEMAPVDLDRLIAYARNIDFDNILYLQEQLMLKSSIIDFDKKPTGLPSKEDYIQWQEAGYSQKEIQSNLANSYNCSERTIRRDMKKKGVTNAKFTTKRNIQMEAFNSLKSLIEANVPI